MEHRDTFIIEKAAEAVAALTYGLAGDDEAVDSTISSADASLASDPVLGGEALRIAARSSDPATRRWAAAGLAGAQAIPLDAYLEASEVLALDGDELVRSLLAESILWGDPRQDLRWSDVAHIIRTLAERQSQTPKSAGS